MKTKNVLKKLLGAALLGAFCAVPALGVLPTAHASQLSPHQYHQGHYAARTFSGVVTNVVSGHQINIRVSGKLYNVYAAGSLPRFIKKGDIVNVTGWRRGNNDIRKATVTVVHNRRHGR